MIFFLSILLEKFDLLFREFNLLERHFQPFKNATCCRKQHYCRVIANGVGGTSVG